MTTYCANACKNRAGTGKKKTEKNRTHSCRGVMNAYESERSLNIKNEKCLVILVLFILV